MKALGCPKITVDFILLIKRNQCLVLTKGVTSSSLPLKTLWSQGGERSGRDQAGAGRRIRVYWEMVETVFSEG